MDAAKIYLLLNDGSQAGPFTAEELHAMKSEGRITPETLCWQDGMADWEELQKVFGGSKPPAKVTLAAKSATARIPNMPQQVAQPKNPAVEPPVETRMSASNVIIWICSVGFLALVLIQINFEPLVHIILFPLLYYALTALIKVDPILRPALEMVKAWGSRLDGEFEKGRKEVREDVVTETPRATRESEKRILPAFLLCFFFGIFGAHRFYVGREAGGFVFIAAIFLVLFSAGIRELGGERNDFFLIVGALLSCISGLVDFIQIIVGTFRDGDGNRITRWT